MKVIEYTTVNFWELLDEHLSMRQVETSSKIEDDVKSIIEDVKKFGDDKIIQFAEKFDNISLKKSDIKISNLKKLYSLDYLNKETIDSFKVAINNIKKYHSIINELFEKYDFLAIPSAQVFPFDINNNFPEKIGSYRLNTYHKWMEVSIIASLFQLPTLSVPVGLNNSGLPMGMQIIGKKASDLKVMSFGKKYESIFNHSNVKPDGFN